MAKQKRTGCCKSSATVSDYMPNKAGETEQVFTNKAQRSGFLLTITGYSAVGSAGGLGAPTEICAVRAERQKVPKALGKPAFTDPLFLPLTTCPTIDRKNSEKRP